MSSITEWFSELDEIAEIEPDDLLWIGRPGSSLTSFVATAGTLKTFMGGGSGGGLGFPELKKINVWQEGLLPVSEIEPTDKFWFTRIVAGEPVNFAVEAADLTGIGAPETIDIENIDGIDLISTPAEREVLIYDGADFVNRRMKVEDLEDTENLVTVDGSQTLQNKVMDQGIF